MPVAFPNRRDRQRPAGRLPRHRMSAGPAAIAASVALVPVGVATVGTVAAMPPLLVAAALVGYRMAWRRRGVEVDHHLAEVERVQAELVEQLWWAQREVEVRDLELEYLRRHADGHDGDPSARW